MNTETVLAILRPHDSLGRHKRNKGTGALHHWRCRSIALGGLRLPGVQTHCCVEIRVLQMLSDLLGHLAMLLHSNWSPGRLVKCQSQNAVVHLKINVEGCQEIKHVTMSDAVVIQDPAELVGHDSVIRGTVGPSLHLDNFFPRRFNCNHPRREQLLILDAPQTQQVHWGLTASSSPSVA